MGQGTAQWKVFLAEGTAPARQDGEEGRGRRRPAGTRAGGGVLCDRAFCGGGLGVTVGGVGREILLAGGRSDCVASWNPRAATSEMSVLPSPMSKARMTRWGAAAGAADAGQTGPSRGGRSGCWGGCGADG